MFEGSQSEWGKQAGFAEGFLEMEPTAIISAFGFPAATLFAHWLLFPRNDTGLFFPLLHYRLMNLLWIMQQSMM